MTPALLNESTYSAGSKLALGTVQFGQPYGVSNTKGQPGEEEVGRILEAARQSGVQLLDTAPAYGDAEAVLGRVLGPSLGFRIVTKTAPLRTIANADARGTDVRTLILSAFENSLERLCTGRVYGLIVHLAEDLLGRDGDAVWRALEETKAGGAAAAIGVSCYTVDEVETIVARYPLELVQLPFNIFDQEPQRSGALARLKARGVEVHARSVFLQGLALMAPDALPDGFVSATAPLTAFRAAAEAAGLTPLELALRFVASVPEIDRMVVGVTDLTELQEIVAALDGALPYSLNTDVLAVNDRAIVTPSAWPPDATDTWSFDFTAADDGGTP